MALPRAYRLPSKEVKSLLRNGNLYFGTIAAIRFRRHSRGKSRFGIVISRKVAPSSVERNSLRRRINGWIFRNMPHINQGFDTVVILKRRASEFTRRELYSALEELFKKIGAYD